MEVLEKQSKKPEANILHKSGNIHELLKAGKNSNINFDISRLSGKGFSNLLEKAKKLQELKVKEEKSILETKKEEFDSIIKKGKETLKKNNISLTRIPDNFEMLKKFSQRFSSRKPNYKINNLLTSIDTQSNVKEENYYGITTTANTNSNSNINSNFNTEKTKTKESIDIGNESKNEKEKDNDESSMEYIKRTERNYNNMEKRKYFHFYSIFNNLSSKNNNKINIKSKLKPRNKNISILNPDSLYQKSDNIDDEENNKKNDENDNNNDLENNSIKYIDENYINDNKIIDDINYIDNNDNDNLDNSDNNNYNNKSNNNKSNNINYNNYKNISNKQENSNNFDYQPGPSPSSTYYIANDLDNNNSFENENYEKNNDSENYVNSNNNSFKIYENNNIKNATEEVKFENDESDNNDNKEENNSKENIINFEEDENNNDILEIESKAIEYETVNSNYSIKQCNSVLEYSFREDQNISYCSLMEDKSKSIENFNNNRNQMLFQLFDGYKGEEIPNFLQQNFTHIYKQYLEETKQNIPRSLVKTFKETDEIIKKLPNIEGKCSTGTVIHIIWENKNKLMVYSGNVGNTKACLVSPVYAIKLTEDQETPEIKFIKMKLKNKKHYKNLKINYENEDSKVFGNYKINEEDEKEMDKGHKKYFKNKKYNNNINNNNNKNEESENNNKHCVPYIAKMEIDLSIKNQFLFLGSDGIWDRVDEDELQYLIENNQDTEQLCSIIVKNVLRRDTTKNISIFVIRLT